MHLQIWPILLSLFVSSKFRFSRSCMNSLTFAMLDLRFVILNCQTFKIFLKFLNFAGMFCSYVVLDWLNHSVQHCGIPQVSSRHFEIWRSSLLGLNLCVWAYVMTKARHCNLQSTQLTSVQEDEVIQPYHI